MNIMSSNCDETFAWFKIFNDKDYITVDPDNGTELTINGSIKLRDKLISAKEDLLNKPTIVRDGGFARGFMSEIINSVKNKNVEILEGEQPEGFTILSEEDKKHVFNHLDQLVSFLNHAIQCESNIICSY